MSGRSSNLFSLFKSYFSKRSQYVQRNGQKPASSNITYGVPQGSIYGSKLFIIYIKDPRFCMKELEMINLAGESILYARSKFLSDLTGKIYTELNKVVK